MSATDNRRLRHHKLGEEEDASKLQLGPDFLDAGCLTISEVKSLLDQRERVADTPVYKKTTEHLAAFSRFKTQDTLEAVRNILRKDATLKQFEVVQLANLCPQDAEEAKALIPSLQGKDDPQLEAMLNEIAVLRRLQS